MPPARILPAARSPGLVSAPALALASALALAACSATPPDSAFQGDTGKLVAPASFVGYEAPAVSAQLAQQFQNLNQSPAGPLHFDGNYKGHAWLVSASGACPNGRHGVLLIGDNVLTYAYTPLIVFQVPVGPDGLLHGVAGEATLDGRIEGERLAMTIATATCTTQFDADFVLNHS